MKVYIKSTSDREKTKLARTTHNFEELYTLMKDPDWKVRLSVIANPDINNIYHQQKLQDMIRNEENPEVLDFMCDTISNMHCTIASNCYTSAETFKKLANMENPMVRECVASNPYTPIEILTQLSQDPDIGVVKRVAENYSTPPEVLAELSKDDNDYVRMYVAQNKNTSVPILELLSADLNYFTRLGVARNRNTPKYVLVNLANDAEVSVRKTSSTRLREGDYPR